MVGLGIALTKNYKAGGSVAMAALIAGGGFGLALASADDSMAIVDAGTPANDYQGTPGAKLTTTRASGATYWDANGVLQTAGNNVLRRDFDPRLASTAERCGYLIEEARTNLALRSEDFSYADWTLNRATVTTNAAVAPDGATTADFLKEDNTTGDHYALQNIAYTSAVYTFSVFAKPNGRDWILFAENSSGTRRTWFNITTGAVGTTNGAHTATITSVGNGWYRCSITFTAVSATTTLSYVAPANANGTNSYAGDNASGVYVWGAQIELGSFASSYIPTAGSTVTRAADLVTLAGTLFPLNQSEGTLYAKFARQTQLDGYAIAIDDGTVNERMGIYQKTGGTIGFLLADGGTQQLGADGLISTSTVAINTQMKAAAAYKLNDSAAALVGETVRSDNVCTMPTTTTLVFGAQQFSSSLRLNGWLFEAAYFPTRKTNSQLQALASGYASDALLLMGAETQGLTFAATDQSMSILDTGTPANVYTGELSAKLGNIRASNAYRYNASGLLELVTDGSLRLDYDSRLTGGPGYLVEEARTNLALRSQDLTTTWANTRSSETADATSAPDGTTTADKLVVDGTAANTHFIAQAITFTNVVHTFSVYLKQAERTWGRIEIDDGTTARYCDFNLATGAVGTASGCTGSIQSVANGFYRCTIVSSAAQLAAAGNIRIYVGEADTDVTFDGNSTDGIHVWGAQLEAGAFATSYIPTTTASVTRAADAPKIATTLFPNNTAAGTFYARVTQISVVSANYGIVSYDANGRALYTASGNVSRIYDGTTVVSAGGTVSALTKYKLASCYGAVGGLQICRDGGTVATGAYDGSFGTQTNLNFGEVASSFLNGWLHENRYFPGEKSAAQLQALAA